MAICISSCMRGALLVAACVLLDNAAQAHELANAGGALARAGHVLARGEPAAAFLASSSKQRDAATGADRDAPESETSTRGWGERLKGSLVECIAGWILFVFSFPLLWIGERRNAVMVSLMAQAEEDAREANCEEPDDDNDGWLVHASGTSATDGAVADGRFKEVSLPNCVRLRCCVDAYQWTEEQHVKKAERMGGKETTVTTYEYRTEWSPTVHSSQGFHVQAGHENPPLSVRLGTETTNATSVRLGRLVLPRDMVNQLTDFASAKDKLPEKVMAGEVEFGYADSAHFFTTDNAATGKPAVGDLRVSFSYVPTGSVTALGLQKVCSEFVPYRPIRRRCCGWTDEDEKRALLKEASKTTEDLHREHMHTNCGPLCCLCNIVETCFQGLGLTPEIQYATCGVVSKSSVFGQLESSSAMLTWVIRLVGWLMMMIGLYMTFSPFITFLAVIPIIAKLGSFIIWVLCFVTTAILGTVVIALAYMAYRPLRSIVGLTLAIGMGLLIYWWLFQEGVNAGASF